MTLLLHSYVGRIEKIKKFTFIDKIINLYT